MILFRPIATFCNRVAIDFQLTEGFFEPRDASTVVATVERCVRDWLRKFSYTFKIQLVKNNLIKKGATFWTFTWFRRKFFFYAEKKLV